MKYLLLLLFVISGCKELVNSDDMAGLKFGMSKDEVHSIMLKKNAKLNTELVEPDVPFYQGFSFYDIPVLGLYPQFNRNGELVYVSLMLKINGDSLKKVAHFNKLKEIFFKQYGQAKSENGEEANWEYGDNGSYIVSIYSDRPYGIEVTYGDLSRPL